MHSKAMLKEFIKVFGRDLITDTIIARKKGREIRAFRDPRRVAIARQFPLTQQQKEEIDDLFLHNYGEKVDYVWHQNYAAHAGRFDPQFMPGLLYISEFEAFENQFRSFAATCEDKNFIQLLALSVGIRSPKTIVSCTNGILRDREFHFITPAMAKELVHRAGYSFLKPTVNSGSGKGCQILRPEDIVHFNRNSIIVQSRDFQEVKNNFVIQELVICHESIKSIYPGSVNTFRVITYFWRGRIEIMPVIIRIGHGGGYLDNAHQGGLFCAVHEDGTMGHIAMTEFNDKFTEHPSTHMVFSLHRIEYVSKVIEAAKRMHAAIPQLGVINWDFTIDSAGNPILIEANCKNGSIWLPQMAHGVGAFGEHTVDVLQWLRFMKKLRAHDRVHYVGGYMD